MNALKTTRLSLNALEGRDMPATNIMATLSNRVLTIEGTNASDSIIGEQVSGSIKINSGSIKIKDGAALKASVPASSVSSIRMIGLDGNDQLGMNNTAIPITLDGGAGDDILYGSNGNDTFIGGAGLDTFWGNGGFNTFRDNYTASQPVLNGVAVDDIHQSVSPTCQTLASLAEGVKQGINFGSYITYKGGTGYDVRLPGRTTQRVSFDGSWTDSDPQPSRDANSTEFWVILMQRARLQSYGVPVNAEWTPAFKKSYEAKISTLQDALKDFTGKVPSTFDVAIGLNATQKSTMAADLQARISKGELLVASSRGDSKKTVNADGVVGNHAYAVMGARKVGSTWVVDLYNPWGTDRDGTTTMDANSSRAAKSDGYVTVTMDAFVRGFQAVIAGKK